MNYGSIAATRIGSYSGGMDTIVELGNPDHSGGACVTVTFEVLDTADVHDMVRIYDGGEHDFSTDPEPQLTLSGQLNSSTGAARTFTSRLCMFQVEDVLIPGCGGARARGYK
jgi:hypothetical protein